MNDMIRPAPVATTPPDHPVTHTAENLLAGGTQARIVLGDRTYTLRLTRAGKLILTK